VDTFAQVIQRQATSSGFLHNHPSGDPKPSAADLAITREIVAAADAISVNVHDHLIIGRDGVASFKTLGLL
jgi:DNA repair protein RadC